MAAGEKTEAVERFKIWTSGRTEPNSENAKARR